MVINIGTTKDDVRKADKKFSIANTISNAEIFTETDLLTPRLIISRERYKPNYNYVYIPAWKRYYYITDPIFDGQKVILVCKVDGLMSFKNYLKDCPCILSRSGGLRKATYIPDKAIPLTGETETKYITFPKQIPQETDYNYNFVLITAGPNTAKSSAVGG